MQEPGKILVASQYYVPDPSTTAVYMAAIAEGLAVDNQVVVLSGSPNSTANPGADQKTPTVIEIQDWTPQKDARRARNRDFAACIANVSCDPDAGET